MIKANATGYFPYTPALPMLYGLREALKMIEEEGLENIFDRHAGSPAACARRSRPGACALRQGAEMVLRHGHRDRRPAGLNAAEVISTAYRRYNLSLAPDCRSSPVRCSASAISAISTN